MFERFSHDARQVVILAQAEARELRHTWIGTEHLLLGLLRQQEGIAAQVLAVLGIGLERARVEVVRHIPAAEVSGTPVEGQIPFTPRAKKVLELSLRESLALGERDIDTEHILLALAREGEGVANQVLVELSADTATIRRETLSRRPEAAERRRRRHGRWGPPSPPRWEYRVDRTESPDWLSVELLDALGAEGWELVAVVPAELGGRLVFKRLVRVPGRKPPAEPDPEA